MKKQWGTLVASDRWILFSDSSEAEEVVQGILCVVVEGILTLILEFHELSMATSCWVQFSATFRSWSRRFATALPVHLAVHEALKLWGGQLRNDAVLKLAKVLSPL